MTTGMTASGEAVPLLFAPGSSPNSSSHQALAAAIGNSSKQIIENDDLIARSTAWEWRSGERLHGLHKCWCPPGINLIALAASGDSLRFVPALRVADT